MKRIFKAAIYTRKIRIGKRLITSDYQLKHLRNYALSKNYKIINEYHDEDPSTLSSLSSVMNRLLNDSKNRLFDVLLIFKLESLSKNAKVCFSLTKNLRSNHVYLNSVTDRIDSMTTQGQQMINMFEDLSQLEAWKPPTNTV